MRMCSPGPEDWEGWAPDSPSGQCRTGVAGSGEPRPGVALTPAHPPCRPWWVPGRRALGWASGCPQSWWSPARQVPWRVGSCVGLRRAPRGGPPRARLLPVSEALPVGVPRGVRGRVLHPPACSHRPSARPVSFCSALRRCLACPSPCRHPPPIGTRGPLIHCCGPWPGTQVRVGSHPSPPSPAPSPLALTVHYLWDKRALPTRAWTG